MQSDAQEASGHPRVPSLIMQWCSTSIWMYIASKATITTEIVLCCTKKDALIMLRHISVYQSRIGFNAVRCSSFCVKLTRSCTTSSWPRHRCGPMWPWRLDFQSPASMSFVFSILLTLCCRDHPRWNVRWILKMLPRARPGQKFIHLF